MDVKHGRHHKRHAVSEAWKSHQASCLNRRGDSISLQGTDPISDQATAHAANRAAHKGRGRSCCQRNRSRRWRTAAAIAMTKLLTPTLGEPQTPPMKLAMCTTGTPMHTQQRKAASARKATVMPSARAISGAPAEVATGALVPCGHLNTGKVSPSAIRNVQPTPTKAQRQSNALMR